MTSPPVLLVAVILSLIAVACGPRLRTCGDDVSDCGEGAYCDEAHGVCVLLLEDGGRWVDPDAGRVRVEDAGAPDAGSALCQPGQTLSCLGGCGAIMRCRADGTWGSCEGKTCAFGLECVAGQCRCSVKSCWGCCENAFTCRPGDTASACGVGGVACANCGAGTCGPSPNGAIAFLCK